MPIVKNLEEARRLPVRVEEQQAQQLAVNPPRSAGDGRQEIQLTAMVPIELPVLSNLACRLLVEVLVRAAGVKELSVPVPVPWRSAPAVVPKIGLRLLQDRVLYCGAESLVENVCFCGRFTVAKT